ncbi:MAG: SoxR reducing system RseC family protein [Betaproteobacteria bacterium]
MNPVSEPNDPLSQGAVEGVARVVAVESDCAWLEPEQGTSCSGCAAMAACGSKGIGTIASRLEQRRFPLPHPEGTRFQIGERVVVGVPAAALVKGSLTAYVLPLFTLLGAGLVAQALYGRDGITLLSSVAGLAVGVVIARFLARRLSARGTIAPRFLRRLPADVVCHPLHPLGTDS